MYKKRKTLKKKKKKAAIGTKPGCQAQLLFLLKDLQKERPVPTGKHRKGAAPTKGPEKGSFRVFSFMLCKGFGKGQ